MSVTLEISVMGSQHPHKRIHNFQGILPLLKQSILIDDEYLRVVSIAHNFDIYCGIQLITITVQ